jgi:hypothetical protein
MGLLEICCENQPSDCFEIVTFAGLASQGDDARELLSFSHVGLPRISTLIRSGLYSMPGNYGYEITQKNKKLNRKHGGPIKKLPPICSTALPKSLGSSLLKGNRKSKFGSLALHGKLRKRCRR